MFSIKIKVVVISIFFFNSMLFSQEKYTDRINQTDLSFTLVPINGGTFQMGSASSEQGHFGDEGPQHQVAVEGFWMSEHEITWDLYNLFVSRELDANQVPKTAQS